MSEGIKLTVLGMGTVFFFLILLTLSIQAVAALLLKTAPSLDPPPQSSAEVPVAAIVAAVREYERELENKP